MTRLLLACMLAAFVVPVHAKAVAYVPNKAGGRIIITDQPCLIGKQAFATDAQGNSHAGCWTYTQTHISIKWIDVPRAVLIPITLLTRMGDVI